MVVLPLAEDARISHLAWRELKVKLVKEDLKTRQYQELMHESLLHKGRTLLHDVEGEVSSGQVRKQQRQSIPIF